MDSGKENGNYCATVVYEGHIWNVEKKMETSIVY